MPPPLGTLVITEMEATKAGLGFLLWEFYQLLLVKEVISCTIAFGLLGT